VRAEWAPRRGTQEETVSMRRTTFAAIAATISAAALLASFAPCASAYGRDFTGSQAPDVYVQQGLYGLPSGSSLASFRGKPVVLKFFFTSCPACRASLPEFDRLSRTYSPRGVQFIAVAYDNAYRVRGLWEQSGYSIPVAIDESGASAARYGVSSFP